MSLRRPATVIPPAESTPVHRRAEPFETAEAEPAGSEWKCPTSQEYQCVVKMVEYFELRMLRLARHPMHNTMHTAQLLLELQECMALVTVLRA